MANTIILNIIIEGVDEETFDRAEQWLCIQKGLYFPRIYEGSGQQLVEEAKLRAEETGETVGEIIEDWATSFGDYEVTLMERELV